ncbi:hypothetical protein PO909_019858 [Leuciscus waleckii]
MVRGKGSMRDKKKMSGGRILWPCQGSSPSQTPVTVRHAGAEGVTGRAGSTGSHWAGPIFGQVLEADSYPSPSRVTARRIGRKIKQVLCEKHSCHVDRFMHIWIGSASCQSAAGRPRIGSQLCVCVCVCVCVDR